jgi:hypothetical protein
MNEDLKRKYDLLKELWEDALRRYAQYGNDPRLTKFLSQATTAAEQAFFVVEKEFRDSERIKP